MNGQRTATGAAVAIGTLAFVSELNVDVIGPLGEGLDRWALMALVWLAPLGLIVLRAPLLADVLVRPPLIWVSWLMVWTVVAAAWSPSARSGSGLLVALGIVACWLTPAWFVAVYGWPRFRRVIAVSALLFLVVSTVYSLVLGLGWLGQRMAGISWSPTYLGRIGAVAVVLGACLASQRVRSEVWLGRACVAVGCLAVGLSGTRTVLIAIAIVGVLALLRSRCSSATTALALTGVAALGVVIFLAVPDEARDLASGTGRTEIWRVAFERILDAPVFGFGTASGELVFDDIARSGELGWRSFTAHNAFLHVLLTLGIVGLALLVGACVAYVRVARHVPDMSRDGLVLLLFVNAFTEALIEQPSLAVALLGAAFVAAANAAGQRGRLPDVPGRSASRA